MPSASDPRSTSNVSDARSTHHEYRDTSLRLPYHSIPQERNDNFYSRATELEIMTRYFCGPQSADHFLSFAVTGHGGMGKTQLVNEFVHAHKESFSVIVWIPADDREKMHQACSKIAVDLGLALEDSVNARNKLYATRLVLQWLKELGSTSGHDSNESRKVVRWLVIFDNVDDPELLGQFWPPYMAGGAILVTSRNDIVEFLFFGVQESLSLEPFSHEESTRLLLHCTGRSGSEANAQQVNEVVRILDGLPLAIYQMAGVITRQRMPFDEFLNQYRDEQQRASLLRAPQIGIHASGYSHTLASVWRFEALERNKHLIDVLSFLDPDGVPEYIVSDPRRVMGGAGILPEDYDFTAARSQLLDMSLITRDLRNRKLVIHRLVQESARSKMTTLEYSTVLVFTLQLLDLVWPRDDDPAFRNETASWKRCNELFTHMIFLGKLAGDARWLPRTSEMMEQTRSINVLLEAAWYVVVSLYHVKKANP